RIRWRVAVRQWPAGRSDAAAFVLRSGSLYLKRRASGVVQSFGTCAIGRLHVRWYLRIVVGGVAVGAQLLCCASISGRVKRASNVGTRCITARRDRTRRKGFG